MRPLDISHDALSSMKKRPIITRTAGTIAVAYIQRQAPISGMLCRTIIADDGTGQRAEGLEAEGAQHQPPRTLLGVLSEIIRWAVG